MHSLGAAALRSLSAAAASASSRLSLRVHGAKRAIGARTGVRLAAVGAAAVGTVGGAYYFSSAAPSSFSSTSSSAATGGMGSSVGVYGAPFAFTSSSASESTRFDQSSSSHASSPVSPSISPFGTPAPDARPVRFAHVTDLHWLSSNLPSPFSVLGKRLIGLTNLHIFGRKKQFEDEARAAILRAIIAQDPDFVLITGDFTSTALPDEYAQAAAALEELTSRYPVFVIPGNHDVYTRGAERGGRLRRWFAPLMSSRYLEWGAARGERRVVTEVVETQEAGDEVGEVVTVQRTKKRTFIDTSDGQTQGVIWPTRAYRAPLTQVSTTAAANEHDHTGKGEAKGHEHESTDAAALPHSDLASAPITLEGQKEALRARSRAQAAARAATAPPTSPPFASAPLPEVLPAFTYGPVTVLGLDPCVPTVIGSRGKYNGEQMAALRGALGAPEDPAAALVTSPSADPTTTGGAGVSGRVSTGAQLLLSKYRDAAAKAAQLLAEVLPKGVLVVPPAIALGRGSVSNKEGGARGGAVLLESLLSQEGNVSQAPSVAGGSSTAPPLRGASPAADPPAPLGACPSPALSPDALANQFLVIATHYPVVDRSGSGYHTVHKMHAVRNAGALLSVLEAAPRKPELVVHGHDHMGFCAPLPLTVPRHSHSHSHTGNRAVTGAEAEAEAGIREGADGEWGVSTALERRAQLVAARDKAAKALKTGDFKDFLPAGSASGVSSSSGGGVAGGLARLWGVFTGTGAGIGSSGGSGGYGVAHGEAISYARTAAEAALASANTALSNGEWKQGQDVVNVPVHCPGSGALAQRPPMGPKDWHKYAAFNMYTVTPKTQSATAAAAAAATAATTTPSAGAGATASSEASSHPPAHSAKEIVSLNKSVTSASTPNAPKPGSLVASDAALVQFCDAPVGDVNARSGFSLSVERFVHDGEKVVREDELYTFLAPPMKEGAASDVKGKK